MKTLTYWVAPSKKTGGISHRAKTRKDCNKLRHKSYQWEPQKVTIPYESLVDLVSKLTGETGLNIWEQSNGKHILSKFFPK